jgi:xylose isomerase
VEELTLAFYEILKHGGFTTGGMNFDSKVRRQSVDPEDLFYGHIGAIDNLALAVERAAVLIENDRLDQFKRQRYAGWDAEFGRKILSGDFSLSALATEALSRDLNPRHASGQQERMENIVNQAIYSGR